MPLQNPEGYCAIHARQRGSCHHWVELLAVFLLWRLAWLLHVPWKLLSEEAFRSVPDKELGGPGSEVYGVFSNRDLPSTSWGQPEVKAQAVICWSFNANLVIQRLETTLTLFSPTLFSTLLALPVIQLITFNDFRLVGSISQCLLCQMQRDLLACYISHSNHHTVRNKHYTRSSWEIFHQARYDGCGIPNIQLIQILILESKIGRRVTQSWLPSKHCTAKVNFAEQMAFQKSR